MRPWGILSEEWRSSLLAPKLLAHWQKLQQLPHGDGRVVIHVPGWKAGASSSVPLRTFLRSLKHDSRDWGLGRNQGTPELDALKLEAVVRQAAATSTRKVALVGWSLGGVICREVARALPQFVSQVITYGTPIVGGPTFTVGASTFGKAECARIAARVEALDASSPIEVPITVIFTRNDRVVSWPTCIDRTSKNVEHVEVNSTHIGLGFDADVWEIVARRLAHSRTDEPD